MKIKKILPLIISAIFFVSTVQGQYYKDKFGSILIYYSISQVYLNKIIKSLAIDSLKTNDSLFASDNIATLESNIKLKVNKHLKSGLALFFPSKNLRFFRLDFSKSKYLISLTNVLSKKRPCLTYTKYYYCRNGNSLFLIVSQSISNEIQSNQLKQLINEFCYRPTYTSLYLEIE